MADFDLEQLKSLFENLGDRLDRTKGDQLNSTELSKIRTLLSSLNKQMASDSSSTTEAHDTKYFLDSFWRRWRSEAPLKAISKVGQNSQSDGGGKTIIEQLKGANRGLGDYSSRQNKLGGAFIGNLNNLNQSLAKGNSDLQKAFKTLKDGGIGGAAGSATYAVLGKASKIAMERTQNYRDLLSSGEGSVSSMQDLGRRAAAAGLTVDQFTKAMVEGTDGARALGAIKFGEVRKTVVEMSKASGYMGMLPDQITEVTSQYAEILRLRGQTQNTSQDQMATGILSIVKSSETTSHILGITRDEALKAQAELAKDQLLNAALRAKGADANTADALITTIKANAGQFGIDRAYDQAFLGQAGPASATGQAISPEIGDAIGKSVQQVMNGAKGPDFLRKAAGTYKDAGSKLYNDKGRTGSLATIGYLNPGLKTPITDILGFSALSQNIKTDKGNPASDQNQNAEQQAGVGLLQLDQVAQDFKVAGDALKTAFFNPMVDTYGPFLRDTVNPALEKFAKGLTDSALGLSKQTGLMATVGTGLLAGLAAIAGITTIFKGLAFAKDIRGILSGGSKLTGLGEDVAEVAGGAVSPRQAAIAEMIAKRNGTFMAEAAGGEGLGAEAGLGAAGLGEGLGAEAGLGAAGLGAGALALGAAGIGVGGLLAYGGGKQIQNRKNESLFGQGKNEKGFIGSRATGYGTSAAGGALAGAAIGSVVPVIGTAVGAGLGALGGLGYAWWNDDGTGGAPSANASQNPQNARPGSPLTNQSRALPGNASGVKPKNALSMDQMTQRIMESSDHATTFLKAIKTNSDHHTELMREEIAVMRGMSDRVTRLLEDGNKNTRSIADHSA